MLVFIEPLLLLLCCCSLLQNHFWKKGRKNKITLV
jgi:hypothetical protein